MGEGAFRTYLLDDDGDEEIYGLRSQHAINLLLNARQQKARMQILLRMILRVKLLKVIERIP